MRHLIDILTEAAADYTAMINPVLAAVIAPQGNGIADNIHGSVSEKIKALWTSEIDTARKNLKKADRVTWYLRMVRAAIISKYSKVLDPAKIAKVVSDYNTKVGLPIDQDGFKISPTGGFGDSILDLSHYLSLPIPAIQNYQFRFQTYHEVIADFQQLEDKWKQSVKDTIEDNDSKIIIDCGGGWYWVDTEKAYCSKEAAAMGHCGNQPRQNSGDHLLSLRKKIMFGNEVRWQPHLTFILNPNGMLTEMKGKNNEKPVEKYHPMIVKLLESDYVKGIIGGGYLPENNFSIDDLDEHLRDELVAAKPELGSVTDLYKKYGPSDIVFDRVYEALKDMGLECDSWVDKGASSYVILETWDDIHRFFRLGTYSNDDEKLAMMADGDFNGWLDDAAAAKPDSAKVLDDVLDSLDDDKIMQLAHKVGTSRDNVVKGLLHMFPNSIGSIWGEVVDEIKTEALSAAKAKIRKMRLRCYDLRLKILADGQVELSMDFNNLCHNITYYLNQDYDGTDGFEYCVHEQSWLSTEDEDDYYGDSGRDDDEDDEVTADSLYEQADTLVFEHLLNLFHEDGQMDFGF